MEEAEARASTNDGVGRGNLSALNLSFAHTRLRLAAVLRPRKRVYGTANAL